MTPENALQPKLERLCWNDMRRLQIAPTRSGVDHFKAELGCAEIIRYQGVAKPVSVKLGVLGTKGVPRKRFEALPVLNIDSQRSAPNASKPAESWMNAFFSHWPALRATNLGKMDNACACDNHQFVQRCATRNFWGAHRCASMAPNRLEARKVSCN